MALFKLAMLTLMCAFSNGGLLHGRHEQKIREEGEWHGAYFSWLTSEQKSELDDIVRPIDSRDEDIRIKAMLAKTLEFYNEIDEDDKAVEVKATNKLQMYCKSKMTSFFGPEEMGELQKLRDAQVPTKQLFAKFNEFVHELAAGHDQIQVRLYAAFCKKIFKLG